MNKTNKSRKFLLQFISIFFILMFLSTLFLGTFFIVTIHDATLDIKGKNTIKQTIIYDSKRNVIETIGEEDNYVTINQIPQVMIDALLSIEDNEFYYHKGFNPKGIILSFINNIFSNNIRGGSTITQQLIKNTALTNERTLTRKIKELYLSILMEQEYSKEQILELYFNKVYFEQSIPGIGYASKYFFNKDIEHINLVEASILASLVKSPSYYHPINHPENANKRKNIVLNSMLKQKAITQTEYDFAIKVDVKDVVNKNETINSSLAYQAYLDLVYEEVKAITGKDLYTHPLIVETYLDTHLQSYIDQIQDDKIIEFKDAYQQIGGVVLDNDETKIIGVIGGRNYQGKKLFNRAYHLKRNPASTMKPLLSYALGVEYLNLHPLSTIKDEEYYYLNTSTKVNNADKKYLGNISLIEALGYSRNTCAVKVFDSLVKKIGTSKIKTYLNEINLMDGGTLTGSYSLGGMTYGISPLQVAGGYAMLANHGRYLEPSTIKTIYDYSGNIIYSRDINYNQVIKEESADIITYSLNKVIEYNYLNINICKPSGSQIAGKTGTNAYDKQTINKLNLPSNADKDIWFAGYSPKATCVIWTGFDDNKEETNYFHSKDERKKISKLIFNKIMTRINDKSKFTYSNKLKETYVIKGLDGNYLPNEFTPSNFIEKTLINPETTSLSSLPNLSFESINQVDIYSSSYTGVYQVKTQLNNDDVYSSLYGNKIYALKITPPSKNEETIYSTDGYFEYEYNEKGKYKLEFYVTFSNYTSLKSSSYITYLFNDNLF